MASASRRGTEGPPCGAPTLTPRRRHRLQRDSTTPFRRGSSYWHCLDATKPEARQDVRKTLSARRGFTESFDKVSETLADQSLRRAGRPGNRNVLTLVTLGSAADEVRKFLDERRVQVDVLHGSAPRHVGVWHAWDRWASLVARRPDAAFLRRAKMLESEFMLRWVSLDMLATHALTVPGLADDAGSKVLDVATLRPSIADNEGKLTIQRKAVESLDDRLDGGGFTEADVAALERDFRRLGQQRATLYEPAIRKRVATYGGGMGVYPKLRPDLIVDGDAGQYSICALTAATSDDKDALSQAIRRTGHTVEFTAHMQDGLIGLEEYIVGKINVYAEMLEFV